MILVLLSANKAFLTNIINMIIIIPYFFLVYISCYLNKYKKWFELINFLILIFFHNKRFFFCNFMIIIHSRPTIAQMQFLLKSANIYQRTSS